MGGRENEGRTERLAAEEREGAKGGTRSLVFPVVPTRLPPLPHMLLRVAYPPMERDAGVTLHRFSFAGQCSAGVVGVPMARGYVRVAGILGQGGTLVHLTFFHNVVLFVFASMLSVGNTAFFMTLFKICRGHLEASLALVKDGNLAYEVWWAALLENNADALAKLQTLVDNTWQPKVAKVFQYPPCTPSSSARTLG
eukprot:488936-Rhodomonas_salina.5